MARGERWTDEEIRLLKQMLDEGKSIDEIARSGKLLGRTAFSIAHAVERYAFGSQIREAEIVGLEKIVARYVDAFNKICDLTE